MFYFCEVLEPTELGELEIYYGFEQSHSAIVSKHGICKKKHAKLLHGKRFSA